MEKGMVYLVGAGPGDPKLITVKGLECIQMADTIIFDRLVNKRLLTFARPGAEMIYAGKLPERHTLKQEEINRLLVDKAREGRVVVRLKGGDPFVFGRGGEEAVSLREASVDFEVVPGVTSAVAAPAYAGIPVTHRDLTSTLAIITGNEDPFKEGSSIAWDKISTGAGTLVFLMGMANLPEITARLVENGRPAQTPVALIRWGTRTNQRTLTGTLDDISKKAREAGFDNPAVIVVGEVVALRDRLAWFELRPLFGRRVLVTRSREQASVLSEAIEALGGEAIEFPVIRIVEPDDYSPLDRAIRQLGLYNWIIFTSVNGVEFFFKRLYHQQRDIRGLAAARLCAIGPKTREALEGYGIVADYVPGEYRAEEIISYLDGKISPGDKVLLPRADIARKILTEALLQMGAKVDEVTTYKTLPGLDDATLIKEMLRNKEIDIVTFTSSSTVNNLVNLLAEPNIKKMLEGAAIACIGPVTAATAEKLGLKVDILAGEYTIEGLIKAILRHYETSSEETRKEGGAP